MHDLRWRIFSWRKRMPSPLRTYFPSRLCASVALIAQHMPSVPLRAAQLIMIYFNLFIKKTCFYFEEQRQLSCPRGGFPATQLYLKISDSKRKEKWKKRRERREGFEMSIFTTLLILKRKFPCIWKTHLASASSWMPMKNFEITTDTRESRFLKNNSKSISPARRQTQRSATTDFSRKEN